MYRWIVVVMVLKLLACTITAQMIMANLQTYLSRCTDPTGRTGLCVTIAECTSNQPIVFGRSSSTRQHIMTALSAKNVPIPLVNCRGTRLTCCPGYELPRRTNTMASLLPSPGECGVPRVDNRVTFGEEADLKDFPWTALLINEKFRGRNALFCGAALINKHYVVTAAHCLNDQDPKFITVRLGEHAIDTAVDCRGEYCNKAPIDIWSDQFIIHPMYNRTTLENDIALIRLAQTANFTDFILPVCLPLAQNLRQLNTTNQWFEFAGFGQTASNGTMSNVKRKISLFGVSQDYCQTQYSKTDPPRRIQLSHLCALGEKNQDTCRGDSGSPLVRKVLSDIQIGSSNVQQETHYIVGISSFGVNMCGTSGWPGVFTRVGNYINWIKDNLNR